MKRVKINQFDANEIIEAYFLLENIVEKEASNKNPFVDFVFSDGDDKITGKMWSTTMNRFPDIKAGDIVSVKAKVVVWEGKKQLNVLLCHPTYEGDKVCREDFIKKAPESSSDMFDYVMSLVCTFKNEELQRLTEHIVYKYREKLLYYPASKVVHHAVKGGLLFHIKRMLNMAIETQRVYENINEELLYAGIILHDIGKVYELSCDEDGITEDYTKVGKLLGHIGQGIKIIYKASLELGISEETSLMLEHMIASHHGDETMGAIRKPMFLEAEILHHLDNIDAKVYMFNSINNVEDGEFSEKQFFLNNRQIYKPNFSS